ncbi:FHA domain-containing protein [Paenibacillus sp. HJL G12]|uniref:FHA domain-containing protein n=1 Tax=Paenibacillus dendrobii TaxID=2691084 RepID=A0A7X3IJC7_9BACL|nr:DUF6382 domain-containing protein [Paenibacillus dendrobii]MWV44401.1 FHA domain-containing protein [Paenibacillus dendrobii]
MVDLTRDFIQQGGTFMILSGKEGIRSEKLSKVEVSMISASRIPHFLPLYVKEVDLLVSFRYDITEKKMLSHMLKGERMNMTEYYSLLLQVAETLEESAMYMLHPGKYVLDEDYIFMDGSLQEGTIYLTYIPLEGTEGLKAVNVSLKELVTRFMASVTELSGGGVQQLLQYTTFEEFTVGGFKKLLLGLLSREGEPDKSSAAEVRQNRVPEPLRERISIGSKSERSSDTNETASASKRADHIPYSSIGNAEQTVVKTLGGSAPESGLKRGRSALPGKASPSPGTNRNHKQHQNAETETPDFFKNWNGYGSKTDEEVAADEESDPKSASSRKTYIALCCLLAAAIVWRLIYMPAPSNGTLIVCVILTLILVVIALLCWTGRLFASKNAVSAPDTFGGLPDFGSAELTGEAKQGKGRSRFEVEQLTGFFRGSVKKEKEKPDMNISDPEPDWKWTFPQDPPVQRLADSMESGRMSGRTGKEMTDGEMRISSLNQRVWNHADIRTEGNTDFEEQDYYGQLGQRTELLNSGQGGATVLLNGSIPAKKNAAVQTTMPAGYLLREGDEGARGERIELRQQHFVIGRSEEVSQYVEISMGASRAHVELSRTKDGGYLIKDLGSKNGTRLKGETMIPYKEYPLHDGDEFIIVKGTYTFRSA